MDNILGEVKENIEFVMKESGINKTQLARLMGVSKSHISRLLSGDRNMRLLTLDSVAKSLNKKLTIIFEDTRRGV